jgi:two-component system, chemotaxis family, chemotaxis protein CheY
MKRILVIDDFATARLYHATLLRQLGHEVVEAVDGLEALERLREQAVDLILLDLLMPKLSGTEFLRRLRQDPRQGQVPIVAITSERSDKLTKEVAALGVDTVLVKPVLPAVLRQTIASSLRTVAT